MAASVSTTLNCYAIVVVTTIISLILTLTLSVCTATEDDEEGEIAGTCTQPQGGGMCTHSLGMWVSHLPDSKRRCLLLHC